VQAWRSSGLPQHDVALRRLAYNLKFARFVQAARGFASRTRKTDGLPVGPAPEPSVSRRRCRWQNHIVPRSPTRLVAANVDIKTVSAILGHSTSRMLLERYAHESEAREQAAITANPGAVGHVLGTPGWAEQKAWKQNDENVEEKLVDGRRLELPTSALRTRRSPN
jgi:hypothetical protein